MTGLDPTRNCIVEIATLITDDELEVVAEGPDLVIFAPEEQLAAMDEVVRAMHQRSGLTRGHPGLDPQSRRSRGGHAGIPPSAHPRTSVGPPLRQLHRHGSALPGRTTCPRSTSTFTTARSTFPPSRNWRAAGTRRRTPTDRRKPAPTGLWTTSGRASRNSATTERRSSGRVNAGRLFLRVEQPGKCPSCPSAQQSGVAPWMGMGRYPNRDR